MTGKGPQDFKIGIIRFIPKKGSDLLEPKSWRPISLINTDSKLLSFVLARRLQPHLNDLICNNKAYIRNRNIFENVLELHAVMKLKNPERYVVITDFAQAFDSISHKWIIEVIKFAGLGTFFEKAITYLLQDLIAFPIVDSNIIFEAKIDLHGGVRQGDPLSGLLFNLAIEPLIRKLKSFINVVLSYADDLCFSTLSKKQIQMALQVMEDFEQISSLKLNKSKSKIIKIGIQREKDNYLCGLMLKQNFEYLGYKYNQDGIDDTLLDQKLEEALIDLKHWKNLNLTFLQKIVVLNVYFFSRLHYFTYGISPNEKFFKKCNQISRWFLTSSKEPYDGRKIYTSQIALERLCRKKKDGGRNLISMKHKVLATKIKIFQKFRNLKTKFSKFMLQNLEIISSKKDISTLFTAKKVPTKSNGYVRDLYKAILMTELSISPVKKTGCATKLFDSIELFIKCYDGKWINIDSPVKEITKCLLENEYPPTVIYTRLRHIDKYIECDYNQIWKFIETAKLRSAIKAFLYKLWNGALFLPEEKCVLCDEHFDNGSAHFLFECMPIWDALQYHLGMDIDLPAFIACPNVESNVKIPMILFSVYCVLMKYHFDHEEFDDVCKTITPKFINELERHAISFEKM